MFARFIHNLIIIIATAFVELIQHLYAPSLQILQQMVWLNICPSPFLQNQTESAVWILKITH